MFARALVECENGIKCDVVQLAMKNYSLSGLEIIACTRKYGFHPTNRSREKGFCLVPENMEFQNRLRTEFAAMSFEMEV